LRFVISLYMSGAASEGKTVKIESGLRIFYPVFFC
jgi:hypothetical protein